MRLRLEDGGNGGSVEGIVQAGAAGDLGDPLDDIVGAAVNGVGGAECPSQFEAGIVEVHGDDGGAADDLGWTRRHLVAHVGYNAAALCRLMDWASSGTETPMYASSEHRGREIQEGATSPAAALRNLFDHTVARLDEKWRHAPSAAWSAQVRTAQGREVPAAETAWMRAREVWIHTVDLDNGGRFGAFPEVVLDTLLTDIVGMWRRKDQGRGLTIVPGNEAPIEIHPGVGPATTVVSGTKAGVVRWCAGRGKLGVTMTGTPATAPTWL